MPLICSSSTSPNNCSHRIITVAGRTYHLHESEVQQPLSNDELDVFIKLAIRHKGTSLALLLNRVVWGDEATNMKLYQFFGPGAAITKTNIGTNYVNIPAGLNGERIVADFTGCTEFRLMLHANLIGIGQFGARIIKDSNSDILIDAPNLGAAGERELDSDWQALPAAFQGQGLLFLRAQAKSQTAADDPVFRSLTLALR